MFQAKSFEKFICKNDETNSVYLHFNNKKRISSMKPREKWCKVDGKKPISIKVYEFSEAIVSKDVKRRRIFKKKMITYVETRVAVRAGRNWYTASTMTEGKHLKGELHLQFVVAFLRHQQKLDEKYNSTTRSCAFIVTRQKKVFMIYVVSQSRRWTSFA